MNRSIIFILILILIILFPTIACSTRSTELSVSAENFYKTNTVTLVVNGSPGANTDFAARCFASYWSDVTGGPAMPVKVMTGGGGIEGLNYVYGAKPDGLTMGITSHSSDITGAKLLALPGPAFDARELGWVGGLGLTPFAFFIRTDASWKTLEDLQKAQRIKVGATNPGGSPALASVISVEILGLTNADVNFGYEVAELGLAAKRGEIDALGLSASAAVQDIAKGYYKPFAILTYEKSDWFPDTPPITTLAKLSPEQENMLSFMTSMAAFKSFFVPPGVSEDKLNYLRLAFDKIMTNDGFLKNIKWQFPIWEKPYTGKQVEEITIYVLSMPSEKTEPVRNLLNKYVK